MAVGAIRPRPKPGEDKTVQARILPVPNYSKLWKSLMRAHLGDYERLDETRRATRLFSLGFVAARERIELKK
jgi:hypothetical protein